MDQLQQLAPLVEKVYTLVADPKLSEGVNSDEALAERKNLMDELHMSPPPVADAKATVQRTAATDKLQPKEASQREPRGTDVVSSSRREATVADAPPWFKEMLKDPQFRTMLGTSTPSSNVLGSRRSTIDEEYATANLGAVSSAYEQLIHLYSMELQSWKHTAASLNASLHHITRLTAPQTESVDLVTCIAATSSKADIIAQINALTAQLAKHV
jgi:hypothetical protein